jgi:uncharacterized protein
MESNEGGDLIFVRLFPGEGVYGMLEAACEKHEVMAGAILSGIGQLRDFELGFFRGKGDYSPRMFQTPHELLSLSGIVSRQDGGYFFHLHAVVGDEGKRVYGGHLIKGTVAVTNEIVMLKSQVKVERRREDGTGLMGLFLD